MKTVVSIPGEIFEKAERLAEQLRISRSRLYSQALREYMNRRGPDRITETLNRVVEEIEPDAYEFRRAAARLVRCKVEW